MPRTTIRDDQARQIINVNELGQDVIDLFFAQCEFIDASLGPVVFNLPSPEYNVNRTIIIKKIDTSSNKITILATPTTIDGADFKEILTPFDSYSVKEYNGQWFII